jgi:hypothetical protein
VTDEPSPAAPLEAAGPPVMPRKRRRPSGRSLLVATAAILPFIGLLTIAGLIVLHATKPSPGDDATAVLQGSSAPPTFPTIPEGEVQVMHRALHGVGETCAQAAPARSQATLDRDVTVLLDFARRHPQGQFAIDDETGTSLSLLLVLRQDLGTCDPAAVPLVESLLPPSFRGH